MFFRSLRCLSTSAVVTARRTTVGMGKKVYAVAKGRKPGLYSSWNECWRQVDGFPANRYKSFETEQQALQYLRDNGVAATGLPPAAAGAAVAAANPNVAAAAPPVSANSRKRRMPSGSERQQAAVHPPAGAPQAGTGTGTLPATGRVFRLEFDGASKRNPGPAGFGAVLYDDVTNVEVARMCQYMGDHHTNNQAEYAGLIAGLQAALELGCQHIKVQGDSTLIIKQVLGDWRVKNEGLQPYHEAATKLKRQFASFQARQVLREYNKAADALSNQAIDDYRSGANPHLWQLATVVEQQRRQQQAGAAAAVVGEEEEEEDWEGGSWARQQAAAAGTAEDAADGAAAAAAAGEAADSEGSSGAEELPKRTRIL